MGLNNVRLVYLKRKLEKKFGLNKDEVNIQAHQDGGKLTWVVHRVIPAGDETIESTLPTGLFEAFKKRSPDIEDGRGDDMKMVSLF